MSKFSFVAIILVLDVFALGYQSTLEIWLIKELEDLELEVDKMWQCRDLANQFRQATGGKQSQIQQQMVKVGCNLVRFNEVPEQEPVSEKKRKM
jgi:hypothetical protein